MKRIANLIDKIKMCKYWLLNHGDALIECCHYCKSTHIKCIEGFDDGDSYNAKYQCQSCGAICIVKEEWKERELDLSNAYKQNI